MAYDSFDALQTLRDEDVISDDAYKTVLEAIAENSTDDDERKRVAFILWELSNGNACNPGDAELDGDTISQGRIEYRVLTDSEADEAAAEYVEQSLWAFNADFLAGETGIDSRAFAALSEQCESANDAIRSMIDGTCGFEEFVKSALSADGRGHFMSSYDGNENEFEAGGETYYIYRIN